MTEKAKKSYRLQV